MLGENMSNTENKRAQALEACYKVIEGIEDGTVSVSSSLLLCKRIARLVNDCKGQEWLNYEYGGYPKNESEHVLSSAWQIAVNHGRSYQSKDKEGNTKTYIFIELCGELEATIDSKRNALGNFTTQGYSVAGEYALAATNRMTETVMRGTYNLLQEITQSERRLSILKSQYYDYAAKWQIELEFGNAARSIFNSYQERVDSYYGSLPITVLQKLNAIEDILQDDNPERYAQVLTSCRRLWSETAKFLFADVLPDFSGKYFITKAGKEIDVSGDHNNNKLSAVIETLQSKAAKNTLVGSETIYLIDWMEQINDKQNTGVHDSVTREQAMQCIIHTYIALGDILSLKASVDKEKA